PPDLQNASGANPNSLPSHKTVTSRCSRRLGLPILGRCFSGQFNRRLRFLRERLQRRLERLQIFTYCLVVCLLFQVLRRCLLRLLHLRIPEALRSTHVHDNSPLSLSLPCTSASHCGLDIHNVAPMRSEE